ncbi:MAG: glycosyltransferase family 4 protein [Candidatus Eisenbacteria bacterium]|nr:glycosyltransferase family 4 protein [Candidatus Eisenbacteria bacterium]
MNVLHLDLGREWRGGQQQVLYLSAGLTVRGHRSVIATPAGSPLAGRAKARDLPVIELSTGPPRLLRNVRELRRLLDPGDFEILHAHTAHAHTVGQVARRLLPGGGRRPHFVVSRRVDFAPGGGPANRWKYLAGDAQFICVSHGVRRIMERFGVEPGRLRVVHSGVEVPDPRPSTEEERRALRAEVRLPVEGLLLGQIGQLVPHKGQTHLIDAFAPLAEEFPQCHLAIFGDGPLRTELAARIGSGPLRRRVSLLGYVNEARRFLRAFDLYVSSSVEEGLGTSILDAGAHGLPVVATTAGGSAETVAPGETGYLVPPGDPTALGQALRALLRDPALRRQMGEAGRLWVAARFSHESMVEGTIACYRELRG